MNRVMSNYMYHRKDLTLSLYRLIDYNDPKILEHKKLHLLVDKPHYLERL